MIGTVFGLLWVWLLVFCMVNEAFGRLKARRSC